MELQSHDRGPAPGLSSHGLLNHAPDRGLCGRACFRVKTRLERQRCGGGDGGDGEEEEERERHFLWASGFLLALCKWSNGLVVTFGIWMYSVCIGGDRGKARDSLFS